MKKKVLLVLIALLFLFACGLAQDTGAARPGVAVASPMQGDETVPMYELPDENSSVLMNFYRGAVLEVLRLEGGDMVRVQSGVPGAGITGYMKRSDLLYGERAMREISPCVMNLRMRCKATVYAYPDASSKAIRQLEEGDAIAAKGISPEGWVQIEDTEKLFFQTGDWVHETPIGGFVHLESLMALATFEADPYSWYILPAEGELTADQALEMAKEYVMGFDEEDTRIPAWVRTREMLDAMRTDVRLIYSDAFKTPQWDVYMETEGAEYGFSVYLTIDGKLVRFEESNG